MPKETQTSRNEAEGGFTNSLRSSAHKGTGRESGIESWTAAGSKSRPGDGSAAAPQTTLKQKMLPPSKKSSHRGHTTKRRDGHKESRVEPEIREPHRSRGAETDSEDDYVYPQERRQMKETKQPYKEVRVLGRDGEDEEAEADARQDERDVRDERPKPSRSKSGHHHQHRHQHYHRGEEEMPREHRSSHHHRTPEGQREKDLRRVERRAARTARDARDSQHSSRSKGDHYPEPVSRTGFLGLFKRTQSMPASPTHRPQTKRNFSVQELPRHRRERDECDEGLPMVPETAEKHKHEKKKEKTAGFFAGMFALAGKEPKEEAPVKLVSCIVCLDDEVKSTRTKKLKCGHRQCHSCLRRNFKLSINDPQQMPPKCCTSDPIPLRAVDKLFPAQWKKKWNRKYEEYTTKNRIYCPAKKCGEWIRPEDIKIIEGKKQGSCRKCKTKVCGTCNGKWHGTRDCPKDAETNALLETAREAGWQRCYSCRTLVELREGCNHMTCRCTAEFCMLCGAKWRTCECPWFNYETVEADRLAHMRVPVDRPPPQPLFPRHPMDDPGHPFAGFLFPPQPNGMQMNPGPGHMDVFARFEMMNWNILAANGNSDAFPGLGQQDQEGARQRQGRGGWVNIGRMYSCSSGLRRDRDRLELMRRLLLSWRGIWRVLLLRSWRRGGGDDRGVRRVVSRSWESWRA